MLSRQDPGSSKSRGDFRPALAEKSRCYSIASWQAGRAPAQVPVDLFRPGLTTMAVSGPAVDRAWGSGASDRSKCRLMPTGTPPSARGPWFGHLSSWRPVALGLGCRAHGLLTIDSVSRLRE